MESRQPRSGHVTSTVAKLVLEGTSDDGVLFFAKYPPSAPLQLNLDRGEQTAAILFSPIEDVIATCATPTFKDLRAPWKLGPRIAWRLTTCAAAPGYSVRRASRPAIVETISRGAGVLSVPDLIELYCAATFVARPGNCVPGTTSGRPGSPNFSVVKSAAGATLQRRPPEPSSGPSSSALPDPIIPPVAHPCQGVDNYPCARVD